MNGRGGALHAEQGRWDGGEATHNLSGQRLGPKGQHKREQIIHAMLALIEGDDEAPVTLSAVARAASVRMSNLYLYFPDMGALLLAVLRRVVDTEEVAFTPLLYPRWPDERLLECSQRLVSAYFSFWQRHARLLHMRNSMAEARDMRMIAYRNEILLPLVELLVRQMDADGEDPDPRYHDCAVVLATGLERMATIVINPDFALIARLADREERARYIERLGDAEASIIGCTISRMRERAGG